MASNVMRAIGIPYLNLGFPRRAIACYQEGETRLINSGLTAPLRQHFYSDKLAALEHLSRFSITEAEALAARGIEAATPDSYPYRVVILGFRLGRCYMKRGNLKKAQKLLESLVPADGLFTDFRPRYRIRFYRDLAALYALLGDNASWRRWMSLGLTLAEEAGLVRDHALLLADHREKLSALGIEVRKSMALQGNIAYLEIHERLRSEILSPC